VPLAEEYGEIVNHKLLLKLLKLWGLTLKRKIRPKKKSWIQRVLDFLGFRANLLFGLVISRIFQVVVSDITEIVYDHGQRKQYLCVHLDYFGKMILGWKLSARPDTDLILASFKMARRKLKRLKQSLARIIFHQDQGSVFTSTDYTTEVLETGAYLSFSRKGEPGDNAVNEAFFSRLKDEQKDYFLEIENPWDLEAAVRKAIDYYNYKRYHTSIGTQTPWDFTRKML
jgi:putative transposase